MSQSNVAGWLPALIGPVVLQVGGVAQTPRSNVNFAGATASDNPSTDTLTITPSGNPTTLEGALNGDTVDWTPTTSPNVKSTSIQKSVDTSDATQTTAVTLALPDESLTDVVVTVAGRSATDQHFAVDLRGTWSRTGGAVTERRASTASAALTGNPAGWAAVLDLSGTNVRVRVTGEAARSIRWSSLVTTQVVTITATPPATIPESWALKAYLQAPFVSSPWAGSASAGDSATRNATEATNPPSVGTSNSADFDGVNDLLTLSGTVGDYYSATAYGGWALVWIDAISSDSGSTYLNDPIVCDAAGYVGVFLQATGPTVSVYHNGTDVEGVASKTFSLGAWQLIQWRYNGTNIGVRVNSGTWATMNCAALVGGLGGTMLLGKSTFVPSFTDGRIRNFGLVKFAPSDADFVALVSALNAKYGLAL